LVAAAGDGWILASIHLGLNRRERVRQVTQLLASLGDDRDRVLIGGDLNAHPDDPATLALAERYPDVWRSAGEGEGRSMPAAGPTARIDYVFASPDLMPTRAWIAGSAAISDHLMVAAEVEVRG
jgi:endonuclease/exonuclease/phosphatase family metal-dependent hydrolase